LELDDLIDSLVEERSLDALEHLTGSKNEEVLEALLNAAGEILKKETADEADDHIVEEIRAHLVESKVVAPLVEGLGSPDFTTRELALACLSEIGDVEAAPAMINLLEHKDAATREAAAEHLALLTHYDLGKDVVKWREWFARRAKGKEEQIVEDQEDAQRRLRMQHRVKKGDRDREGDDNADDDDRVRRGGRLDDDDDLPDEDDNPDARGWGLRRTTDDDD
jgi:hypothetical protein